MATVASAAGFSAGPPMASAREYHSATLLPSGEVLVVGGRNLGALFASTELYAPDTETWSAGAPLATARDLQTAVLLPSGEVLVIGGVGSDGYGLNSCELYDPENDTWRPAASTLDARSANTTTLLPSGRVLVTGGYTGHALLFSTEIYDPASDTWTAAAPLSTYRMYHSAALLASGKVLVSGGSHGARLDSAEIYDEASDTWTPAAPLGATRELHTSTTLPSGDVLVFGGYGDGGEPMNAELYHPDTDSWTAAGTLTNPRFFHTATLLASGKVLAVGGYGTNGPRYEESYVPANNFWAAAGGLITARADHTATLLSSGKVLVTGGYDTQAFHNNQLLASTEIYDPAASTFTMVLSSTPTVTVVGQSYDVAFRVLSGNIPTGSVTVRDDAGASCGPVTLVSGNGSCALASTAAGQRVVTASYTPDDVTAFIASSGDATHQVDRAATSLQITSEGPDPSLPDNPVTVSVALAAVAPGAGTPGGEILVSDGLDECTIPAGRSSCDIAIHERGSDLLIASYAGDDNFGPANASVTHVVNQLPVPTADAYGGLEDEPFVVDAQEGLLGNDTDPDGDPLAIASAGTFQADGIGGIVTLAADGSYSYAPPADANGVATFDYVVSDGLEGAVSTVTITVAAVNDAPGLALQASPEWAAGTTGAQTVANFASVLAFGPPDEAGQHVLAWHVRTIADDSGVLSDAADIDTDGTLHAILSGHAGVATIGVTLQDDGGTANGGADTSTETVFTITVDAESDTIFADGFDGA